MPVATVLWRVRNALRSFVDDDVMGNESQGPFTDVRLTAICGIQVLVSL